MELDGIIQQGGLKAVLNRLTAIIADVKDEAEDFCDGAPDTNATAKLANRILQIIDSK